MRCIWIVMHCPLQIVRMYEPHNHEGREHGKLNGFSTRKQGTQAICLPVGCVDVGQEIFTSQTSKFGTTSHPLRCVYLFLNRIFRGLMKRRCPGFSQPHGYKGADSTDLLPEMSFLVETRGRLENQTWTCVFEIQCGSFPSNCGAGHFVQISGSPHRSVMPSYVPYLLLLSISYRGRCPVVNPL